MASFTCGIEIIRAKPCPSKHVKVTYPLIQFPKSNERSVGGPSNFNSQSPNWFGDYLDPWYHPKKELAHECHQTLEFRFYSLSMCLLNCSSGWFLFSLNFLSPYLDPRDQKTSIQSFIRRIQLQLMWKSFRIIFITWYAFICAQWYRKHFSFSPSSMLWIKEA